MSTLAISNKFRPNQILGSSGFSEDAQRLSKFIDGSWAQLKDSLTWGAANTLFDELIELFKECHAEGWTDDDNCPIIESAYQEARDFIEKLPMGIQAPEIVSEPDGGIGFEWYAGKGRVFVVSFEGSGMLSYAGLLGGKNRTRGAEEFNGDIPALVFENIQRIYN